MMMVANAKTPARVRISIAGGWERALHSMAGLSLLPLAGSQRPYVRAEANAVTNFAQATFSQYFLVDVQ